MKTTNLLALTFALASFCVLPATYAGVAQGSLSNNKNGLDALHNNTTGVQNDAEGVDAMYNNTNGSDNTADGFAALYNNTTANQNTAVGSQALFNNATTPDQIGNTAVGFQALYSNTTGESNSAIGIQALFSNTTGFLNTANGRFALLSNTTGIFNTATGASALKSNTTGDNNTADGRGALINNSTGSRNSVNGTFGLQANSTGNNNTVHGFQAMWNNTTGNNNIALGAFAGFNLTSGDNNIDIGNEGVAAEANTIRIGDPSTQSATFVAGIFGSATSLGMPVYVDASGHLGTTPSSQRFKNEIKPMDKASEAILSLRPVTFRYKSEPAKDKTPQFGLIAEEVAKVNPDLVLRDGKGEIYSVRYEAVNAMLLNEFIKEHRQVQEQQKQIDKLTAQLKEQASMLQKVSAQVELIKTAPRTVADSH